MCDVRHPEQEAAIDKRRNDGPDLDAKEWQRGIEPALAHGGVFRHHHGSTRLFRPGPKPLQHPGRNQQDGRPYPYGLIGRDQPDTRAGKPHKGDRHEQDLLAADMVAQTAKNDPAHGPHGKPDEIGRKTGNKARDRRGRRKEKRPENQRRGQAVEREIIIFQRTSQRACPRRAPQFAYGQRGAHRRPHYPAIHADGPEYCLCHGISTSI